MKKLIILSQGTNTGSRIYEQLYELFADKLEIENVLVDTLKDKAIDADLVLFTTPYLKNRYIKYISSEIPYIVAKRIIDHKNIKEIIGIDEGKDVLLINDAYDTAKEAIKQLMELGLNHIQYHPYYPECKNYPELKIAITPGEKELAPYKAETLIDLGARIVDIPTIHEIASSLNLQDLLKESLIIDYLRDIVEISKTIEESRRKDLETQQILATVVNSLDIGIGLIDLKGNLTDMNPKCEYILGSKRKDIVNKNISQLIETEKLYLRDGENLKIKINGKIIAIEIREVRLSSNIGYIMQLKELSKSDKELFDKNIIKRNLYDFDDYLTINKDAESLLKKARKFAKTDATILIQGENGTGKEILAQGIHMNSYRSNKVFIPINMTTIASNLVESELFGYEEGTFTGALKGGRVGLFEMANGGTLFIDEIGDTPLDVQAKLLRVLEEKRIRKVGSMEEKSVDVRIIAATNKNLLELAKKKKFRIDLFFRLNILPLDSLPLRKRREDIPYLLDHFLKISLKEKYRNKLNDFFTEETIDFLINYSWIGNVRELINLVDYLVLIYDDKKISMDSLHAYMIESLDQKEVFLNCDEVWVLEKIYQSSNSPIGRVKIRDIAVEECKDLGEGKIRRILRDLEENQLIVSLGGQGCKISKEGRQYLSKLKERWF